jgi:hypothetical protein
LTVRYMLSISYGYTQRFVKVRVSRGLPMFIARSDEIYKKT